MAIASSKERRGNSAKTHCGVFPSQNIPDVWMTTDTRDFIRQLAGLVYALTLARPQYIFVVFKSLSSTVYLFRKFGERLGKLFKIKISAVIRANFGSVEIFGRGRDGSLLS